MIGIDREVQILSVSWTLSIIYGGRRVIRRFAVGDDSSRNASQPDKSTFNMPFESESFIYNVAEVYRDGCRSDTVFAFERAEEREREREYWMHMLISNMASARYYHPISVARDHPFE